MRPVHGASPSSAFQSQTIATTRSFHGLAFAPELVTLSHEFYLWHRRSPSLQSRAFNGQL